MFLQEHFPANNWEFSAASSSSGTLCFTRKVQKRIKAIHHCYTIA